MMATKSPLPVTNTSALRQEVLDFILVAETLLTPALRSSEFTEEECGLIAEYVTSLCCADQPWAKSLPVRYNI